jgi:hypothetical protein
MIGILSEERLVQEYPVASSADGRKMKEKEGQFDDGTHIRNTDSARPAGNMKASDTPTFSDFAVRK